MRPSGVARTALMLLASVCWGCASAGGPEPPPVPPAPPPPPAPRAIPAMATLESVTAAVRADAAKLTGLAASALEVESAEQVTWSDGSLGCPQPGMTYTMALVPGYRIRIRAGERLLDYHASMRGHFVLCPAGQAIDPLDGAAVR
jgi:hypothetical protein